MPEQDHQTATIQKYLARHAEPEASAAWTGYPVAGRHYHHSLVVPAYREHPEQLPRVWEHLVPQQKGTGSFLVILVINAPDVNDAHLAAAQLHAGVRQNRQETQLSSRVSLLRSQNEQPDLLVVNRYAPGHRIDGKQGVGLARKIGMDLALRLAQGGRQTDISVASQWLCSTDADAVLPEDYFQRHIRPGAVAEVLPFQHLAGATLHIPILLYELRMLYYAAALQQAGSPYGYTSIGSTLTCTTLAYAQVRGCPKRNTGEDFYLLNKLAKVGTIGSHARQPILLEARLSERVPIGTGTALAGIAQMQDALNTYPFYHPDCFHALASFLALLDAASSADAQPKSTTRLDETAFDKIATDYWRHSVLEHLYQRKRREHPATAVMHKFLHDWFDALRTLQFIHQMRDAHFGTVPAAGLAAVDFIDWELNTEQPQASLLDLREQLHQVVFSLATATRGGA